MNKRHMVSRPATMGVRTGTLRDVLKEHAQERCEHYFKYLFSMKSLVDRWLADRDFVTREEFDAVRAMAQKAREENAALSARLDALEAKK